MNSNWNVPGTSTAINPGVVAHDILPTDGDNVSQQVNLRDHKGKERTIPVVMWSGQQEYLMKTSPTNVLFSGDYGTGKIQV